MKIGTNPSWSIVKQSIFVLYLKAEKIVGLHSEVYLNDSGNLPNTKGSFVRTVSPPSGKKRTKNYYFFYYFGTKT